MMFGNFSVSFHEVNWFIDGVCLKCQWEMPAFSAISQPHISIICGINCDNLSVFIGDHIILSIVHLRDAFYFPTKSAKVCSLSIALDEVYPRHQFSYGTRRLRGWWTLYYPAHGLAAAISVRFKSKNLTFLSPERNLLTFLTHLPSFSILFISFYHNNYSCTLRLDRDNCLQRPFLCTLKHINTEHSVLVTDLVSALATSGTIPSAS